MSHPTWILSEGYAGLQAQALGLAEAAGLTPDMRVLKPTGLWRKFPARFWPRPLGVVADAIRGPAPDLAIGCGGMAGAVLAKIVVLVALILFIQRKPRGMFPLKGRAVEA